MMCHRLMVLLVLVAVIAACAESHVAPPQPPTTVAANLGIDRSLDDCDQRVTTNLPGASLRVTTERCTYSLAELIDGVDIDYEVRVERALHDVKPYTWGADVLVPWPRMSGAHRLGCLPPDDASNLSVANWFWTSAVPAGQSGFRVTCPSCDIGRCEPQRTPPVDVQPGNYPHTWRNWTGRSWTGGSDTYREPGKPFPPGDYELLLRADGSFIPAGHSEPQLFHMQTTRRITITP